MSRAEREGLPYLFKLRTTRNVKRLLERAMAEGGWVAAGRGFEGKDAVLGFQTGRGATCGNPRIRLAGWSRARQVALLRGAWRANWRWRNVTTTSCGCRFSTSRPKEVPDLRSCGAGNLARG